MRIALILILLAASAVLADWWIAVPPEEQAQFVGGASCMQCHQSQYQKWQNSHHDLAMQVATPATVLGDFNNATVTHHGITSRLFRRADKFWINTEGPDGKLHDYEIKYCFAVDPLQQYLVEFDRRDQARPHELGRLQVLRITWDTRKRQWFYLPPPDVPEKLDPSDDLHWTGLGQRWNTMCAECHSTNLKKNFDPSSLTYATTFTDIDVNCEACHGPGSVHVKLATAYSLFWDRRRGYGITSFDATRDAELEIQSCAPCHSRRSVLAENYPAAASYHDYYGLELPSNVTYFADGQIKDEVYEYGSFLQSKMYHQRIRCSDCHDPHSARLNHNGNQVCTSCHQHPAGKYDAASHHQHQPGSTGAACVECHMPNTTYMEVDARRDHSLRIPRPDLSVELGVPNACTQCHLERAQLPAEKRAALKQYRDWVSAAAEDQEVAGQLRNIDQWAADAVARWFPYSKHRTQEMHFGQLLASAWLDDPQATPQVLQVATRRSYPAVIRAAAWQWLRQNPSADVLAAAEKALSDRSPLVRAASVQVFEGILPTSSQLSQLSAADRADIAVRMRQLFAPILALLGDPVRLVRFNAATVLSRISPEMLSALTTGSQRQQLDSAIQELVHSRRLMNDRADGQRALALLFESRGHVDEAIAAYRAAIRVQPQEVGARSNLALLLEQQAPSDGRHARQLLEEAAALRKAELPLLQRDARLAPKIPEVHYRYGMALYLDGQKEAALQPLQHARQLQPKLPQYVLALATLHRELGHIEQALEYANELVRLTPRDPSFQQLLQELRAEEEMKTRSSAPGPP